MFNNWGQIQVHAWQQQPPQCEQSWSGKRSFSTCPDRSPQVMTQPLNLHRPCQISAEPLCSKYLQNTQVPSKYHGPVHRLSKKRLQCPFRVLKLVYYKKQIYCNFNLPIFLLRHLSPFSLNPEIASEKKGGGGTFASPHIFTEWCTTFFLPFFFLQ